MNGVLKKLLLSSLGLLVAALYAPGAKADNLDFSCGSGTCSGNVSTFLVGGVANYSATGANAIGVTANFEGDTFNFTFNTATGVVSLVEVGDASETGSFSGTITGFSASTGGGLTDVNVSAIWNSFPSDISASSGVTPFTFIASLSSTGQPISVDVPVTTSVAVPEPSALALLGAALLSLGLLLKFKAPVTA